MRSAKELMDEFFATHQYDDTGDWRSTPATDADPDDETVSKEFSAPSSATSGLAGYSLEGQKKKKRRGPRYVRKAEFDEGVHIHKADLGLLVKRRKLRRTVSSRVDAALKAHEGRVARKLAVGLRKAGARLAQELRAKVKLPTAPTKLARLLGRALLKAQTPTQEELDRILDSIDLEGFAVSIMDDVMPELEAAFKEAGLEAVTAAGIDATEEIVTHMDERALEFAQERGAEMVGKKWVDGELIDNPEAEWSIEETTRDALRLLTGDAVEEGMSSQEFADAIEESGEFSDARALMIARTELATAHVQGNLEGWRESGVVSMKQWIVADADVCDICDPMDEEEVPLDEAFSSGDDGPPLHPNCRCDVVGVVEGDETATAEDSGDTEE